MALKNVWKVVLVYLLKLVDFDISLDDDKLVVIISIGNAKVFERSFDLVKDEREGVKRAVPKV